MAKYKGQPIDFRRRRELSPELLEMILDVFQPTHVKELGSPGAGLPYYQHRQAVLKGQYKPQTEEE